MIGVRPPTVIHPSSTHDTQGGAPGRTEWMAVLAITAACAAVVLATSADLWFFSDVWPTLAERPLRSTEGWLRPHGGHWLVPATVASRALFELFGMNFYPWFFLPRIVLTGGLAIGWWRVCRWRGVDPLLAVGVVALFSWLGLSGWIVTVVYIGPLVVNACALVAAYVLHEGDASPQRQVILGTSLVVAAASSASGPALLFAVGVVAVATGTLRRFVAPIALSGGVYATWYLMVARLDPSPLTPSPPTFTELLASPVGALDLMGAGLAGTVGLGPGWAFPAVAVFLVVLGVAARRGRLGRFEAVLLITGVTIALLGVIVRGGQGIEVNAPNRLYLMSAYLFFGLVPAVLRAVPDRRRVIALAVLVVLAVGNLMILLDEIDQRERVRSADRPLIETTAAVIAGGEEYIPWTGPSPQAHHKNIQVLVDHGWNGQLHDERLDEVLAGMKLEFFSFDAPQGTPLIAGTGTVDGAGCLAVDGSRRLAVHGRGNVVLHGVADTTLILGWEEDGRRVERVEQLPDDVSALAYANPASGDAVLTIEGDTLVCGVAPSVD